MFHVLHSLVPLFFSYLCISVLARAHPHTSALIFARFHMSALGFTPILTCVWEGGVRGATPLTMEFPLFRFDEPLA
ncbi:hypothetical protein DFJ58DRAFT_755544 [Suillus subalutaceus]|uniref:uncharacterized protein n=1 Tax=Suillus subalutaceus TaxID=48586 RepID=UPI001B868B62|nr:uncharacterized protein DFJ58DRAFT_755544 [Suillus subalutaceus]KAG1876652.1 hypothetical protein DFJ58DRAFT_755544 [Suillus subalutaceus]